jgi:type IV pilus assembly protein PilW
MTRRSRIMNANRNRFGIPTAAASAKGFSTVELLVAMTLGLFLASGILGLFITNKAVFTATARATELQENGRFALSYLMQDLRHAYFFGEKQYDGFLPAADPQTPSNTDVINNCSGIDSVYSFNDTSNPPSFPLHGSSATDSTAIGCIADALVVNGIPSDILILKFARPAPLYSTADLDYGSVYIASNRSDGMLRLFTPDTTMPLLSSTCTGRTDECLPYGAYWPYTFSAYYIRANANDTDPPALARMTLEWDNATGMNVVSEDLVEGVEGMRILYGVSADDAPETFAPAGTVSNWHDVVSVQLHLLLRTTEPDRSYNDDGNYRMGDVTVSVTTSTTVSQGATLRNFRRSVLSSTVMLRNKPLID